TFVLVTKTNAQFSMNERNMISLVANTTDWTQALRIYVPTYNSCAYNLWYGGKDRFFVHASGYLWCERGGYFGSDSTLKENISKLNSPLTKLKKLNGYEYNYKNDNKRGTKTTGYIENEQYSERRLGLLAQEVEKVFPGIVKTMPDSTKAIAYNDLTALLIESIKEQQVQIETLQTIVYSQEKEIVKPKKAIDNCCTSNNNSKLKSATISDETTSINELSSENAKLFDNIPNPFSINTEIKFEIPEKSYSARLIIHDLQGIEIKSYAISQGGFGSITINGSDLMAGMYLYTLMIDNKIIDTKRMILTKE
uniref:tail fiber domain-containing protein n=1 Tax=Prevotella heparinolytica TaxID=28113 RepID=UPI0035A0DEF6